VNDSELDALIARYGDDYHRPPENPPLREIRERMHQRRPRFMKAWLPAATVLAVAAVMLLAIVVPRREDPRETAPVIGRPADGETFARTDAGDARIAHATVALASAIHSAEQAAQRNPRDEFYRNHLQTMVENAEYFRILQQRQLQGIK
jgi:flagellar biosynthesis/type III secretory pathway M-ring protein FliF/YscJ